MIRHTPLFLRSSNVLLAIQSFVTSRFDLGGGGGHPRSSASDDSFYEGGAESSVSSANNIHLFPYLDEIEHVDETDILLIYFYHPDLTYNDADAIVKKLPHQTPILHTPSLRMKFTMATSSLRAQCF